MQQECPVDGCEKSIPLDKLMCPTHWRQVPRDLQGEVYAAWRRRVRGDDGAMERHQAAKDAAIHAVETR
jgi:hypothetical protein